MARVRDPKLPHAKVGASADALAPSRRELPTPRKGPRISKCLGTAKLSPRSRDGQGAKLNLGLPLSAARLYHIKPLPQQATTATGPLIRKGDLSTKIGTRGKARKIALRH